MSRQDGDSLPELAGDGWVNCAQGHGHWGRFGGAGLIPVHRDEDGGAYVLLHQRSEGTDQGGTWSLLGGARDSHESPAAAALREAGEESDLDPARLRVETVLRDDHGGWAYDTVVAAVDERIAVRPVEGESLALAWVPVDEVAGMNLHPGFAASWPRVREALTGRAAAVVQEAVSALPAHPVTGSPVIAHEPLEHGDGVVRRELASFADGTRAVYEEYGRAEDATSKVLDAYVGRSVGARVPLSHPVAADVLYTDDMPGTPADGAEGLAATRDGVFLGLHHALTGTHGFTERQLALGAGGSLIPAADGAAEHGPVPDPENPFVRTFFRETEPHLFSWVDNPVPPSDAEIMRRQLDSLRPLFEHFGRTELHDEVMERFGQVAEHARGTDPLLPRPPREAVTLPDTAPERHYRLPPPAGSPERAEHQRVGEALLTDDGRVTETPEAKTIAIRELAERMRSSTPELVLAAMGLGVGNDMADHLGDARYVLVPHNERYPSMGADVLRRDELDPAADPRHAPERVIPMDEPRADTLVRMIAVSELMGSWAYGSNNNVRVLALQEVAKEEFGLTEVLEWRTDAKTRFAVGLELDYNRDALRDFLRTQYEMTQETLAARGVTEVMSYRALTWPEGAPQPDWAGLEVGDAFEARQRPLASWSADRQVVADWLEQRGGSGVVLADLKPARDVLSLPLTGMGYLTQKEWVTLPGDSLVTLDGVFSDQSASLSLEATAASSVSLGAPQLGDETPVTVAEAATPGWRPQEVATGDLDPADPLNARILRVLDGAEEPPEWWPRDDSGYAVSRRDLDFLGISPVQMKWLLTGEAPMGMTPEQYRDFGSEMLDAMRRDGIDASEVDVRLKGTGSGFFSGIHKTLPTEEELAAQPAVADRLREWLGDDPDRPVRRPYDAMWRLGLEPEPSDYDLDINSTAIVRAAREYWRTNNADRYPGDFMGGHGYLDKQTALSTMPALADWAARWEERLGRPLSLGVFESSGPFDATVLGRALSSHFKDTDWVIHGPDEPRGWENPRSRIPLAELDPLRGLTDDELVRHQESLKQRSDRLTVTDTDAVAARLREAGAAPEVIERATRAAAEDRAHVDAVGGQLERVRQEAARREGLSPRQRQAEQVLRDQQRAAAQPTPGHPSAPRIPGPDSGQSRGGAVV